MPSEFELIARYFNRPVAPGLLGVGDDCALFPVPAGHHVATSTDLLVEGRHFYPDVDPQALGHKSLAVNLSDLAAMGARPLGCVLGLAMPRADDAWLAPFSQGWHALGDAWQCPLVGGDTTGSKLGLTISVTVFGAVRPGQALRRDAARPGDDIWVSGELGAADVAYRLLDGQLPADPQRLAATRRALEWPQPRVGLGLALAGLAHAAIDISDGLLQDLGHILAASRAGAELRYADLPVAASLDGLDEAVRRRAVLGGGDVYELCFTAAASDRARVQQAALRADVRVTHVGSVRAEPGVVVRDAAGRAMADLPAGFDHFPTAAQP
ncbi:thiamine-monophosphate kinase [Bordetella ansorpii]|uniref:Thiamine-monophosphate kinase n=1 Tax=Bordetella ansorpii TaxID=288768 RepID=A0A157SGX9_9BORD|nr:thiamine-phosphate kinase [Bordetella ansorpii]SAI69665.1 thiamine-monophosphate kinase [Bordetella ansorpii]